MSVQYQKAGLNALELPVTKIARDDTKRVLPRKEWRNKFPESNFLFLIYCTDEDGNNGYIQPRGIFSPGLLVPKVRSLTLGTLYAHKADAFQCCAHLRQSVYPYR